MNMVHVAPQPSLGATWATALSQKIDHVLRRHVEAQQSSPQLHTIHLHMDVPGMLPKQKGAEQVRRDAARHPSTTQNVGIDGSLTQDSRIATGSTLLIIWVWKHGNGILLGDEKKKDVIASVHVALAAVVVHDQNAVWNASRPNRHKRSITAYCHGAAIAVHPDAVGEPR